MIEHVRVVLLRSTASGVEVLVRRRGDEAWDFPGGGVHDNEDPRVAVARTLFEDTGVLLARDAGEAETLEVVSFGTLRKKVRDGANATELLRSNGLTWTSDAVMPWSHWLTPSIEAARTSTKIYLAELPGGAKTAFGPLESVTELWLSLGDASSTDLALSPMLVRTLWELSRYTGLRALFTAARKRAEEPQPILPRLAARADSRCLLLPWDPEYETGGQGESHPFAYQPSWATGPSRFVLEDRTWKHVDAPGSTSAV